jgi:cytosine/adenosine deaminase-related metal-dependent hydrolase
MPIQKHFNMPTIHVDRALLPDGWAHDVTLEVIAGRIASITQGDRERRAESGSQVDTLLPALGNLHSHSFQRAMAGMTERRAEGRSNFWSWRALMYPFAQAITPEQYYAIAALNCMEMQKAGMPLSASFTRIHHQPGGRAL